MTRELNREESGVANMPGLVVCHIIHDDTVNAAMQQCGVPFIKEISITCGGGPIEGAVLAIRFDGGLAHDLAMELPPLIPGQTLRRRSPAIVWDGALLASRRDEERGSCVVSVTQGETSLCEETISFRVLPWNCWSGVDALPELLASFVIPNHPAVAEVAGLVRDALTQATGDGALVGYQPGNTDRVEAIIAASYGALTALGITYATVDEGFVRGGQLIRLPEMVLHAFMGNCLDLSLFTAGVLEHMGLAPVLLLTAGHAMVGCWTRKETLPTSFTDSAAHILKLCQVGDMVIFDVTMAIAPPHPFAQARKVALELVGSSTDFVGAVDVRRARREKILPLPPRALTAEFGLVEGTPATLSPAVTAILQRLKERQGEYIPAPLQEVFSSENAPPKLKRVERWKEKLLDLSLRNRLLNYRESKKSIPLLLADVATLEDALASGQSFSLVPQKGALHKNDPRDAALVQKLSMTQSSRELLAEAQARGEILVPCTTAELDRRLKEMAREARVHLEEGGANTLFLALGFLSWRETEKSSVERLAPLVLIPVQLTRRSARERFTLSSRDEDPVVNVTLLEKLRKEYGIDLTIMNDPPRDERGLDIPAVLAHFRKAVLHLDGWQVREDVVLGLFSFTKFLMWRDLEMRSDELMADSVVKWLFPDERAPFPSEGEMPDPTSLDGAVTPDDIFCPMDADSSQLAAIVAAAKGRSFILEGPPGTGKSQTITNLITHCLHEGMSVLFVSEKMAALEVVQKRLERVGMGRFCLELHSNKARKRQVLEELGRSCAAPIPDPPAQWDALTAKVARQRDVLNEYARELHRVRTPGCSYFDAVVALSALDEAPRVPLLFGEQVEHISEPHLTMLREKIAELVTKVTPFAPLESSPMRHVGLRTWSPGAQEQIAAALEEMVAALTQPAALHTETAVLMGVPALGRGREEVRSLGEMSALLSRAPGVPAALIDPSQFTRHARALRGWVAEERRERELSALLEARYTDALYELDVKSLYKKVARWAEAFFLFAFFALFFTRRKIRRTLTTGPLPPNRELAVDLERAGEVLNLRGSAAKGAESAAALFGELSDEDTSRWAAVEGAVSWSEAFLPAWKSWNLLPSVASLPGARDHMREMVTTVASEPPGVRRHEAKLTAFAGHGERLMLAAQHLEEVARLSPAFCEHEVDLYAHLTQRLKALRQALPTLREWTLFNVAADSACDLNLEPLVAAMREGVVSTEAVAPAFERAFFTWFVDKVSLAVTSLGSFHGGDQDRLIDEFTQADSDLITLTSTKVVADLSAQNRVVNDGNASSEMGILIKEIKKKRGNMPLRKLFETIKGILPKLKPCLLMSPLSVAQYLDPSLPPFDLVVFDEASQIPVHDAIGAIARGRQLVVVGDSKQLPPTTFFNRGDGEEEAAFDDDLTELESILAEVDTIQMPKLRLNWHYRSRHEHLIAFSNAQYYERSLNTFPSRREGDRLGVKWHHIKAGVYDKGKARSNRQEAAAVVAEVVRRLTSAQERSRSLGIVTFSMSQQQLIEDLLEKARQDHPEIEPYFSTVPEPVFIKNLENVQGDERDVMLFSICYGPDQEGHLSMNFGPLNREGGERRLNVAVTRAREEMVVFSSLLPEHIDLRRTSARGVHDLRLFLEYARRGPAAVAPAATEGVTGSATRLHEQIASALRDRGWGVRAAVGCSEYRIDLGVIDPDDPAAYLLGVTCDGASYRSAATARDRDRLREAVLRGLGWELTRVWSTDWWVNRQGVLTKLDGALAAAVAGRADVSLSEINALGSAEEGNEPAVAVAPEIAPLAPREVEPGWLDRLERPVALPGIPYTPWAGVRPRGVPEGLYDEASSVSLRSALMACIDCEAPVHERRVARLVLEGMGVKRLTAKVLTRCAELVAQGGGSAPPVNVGGFWWRSDQDPDTWPLVRHHSGDPSADRAVEEIPERELHNGARALLARSVSLSLDELAKATASLFGFARLGSRITQQVTQAIDEMVAKGEAVSEGERIRYVDQDEGGQG